MRISEWLFQRRLWVCLKCDKTEVVESIFLKAPTWATHHTDIEGAYQHMVQRPSTWRKGFEFTGRLEYCGKIVNSEIFDFEGV